MATTEQPSTEYPLGRGYGHDYMRGGEVFDGYGHATREEFARRRGELEHQPSAERDRPQRAE
jgi:hypothetical protein